jgi:hypothetical protein
MTDEEQVTPDKRELSLDDDIDTGREDESLDDSQIDDDDVSEKRVRDAQKQMHEATKRASDLEKQLEKMNGQITTLTDLVGKRGEPAPTIPQENPFDFLDDEKVKETLLDSPENVASMLKRTVAEIGRTLSMRDKMLLQELNQRDPEIRSVRDQLNTFREEHPELDDLSDQQLVKVMKLSTKEEAPRKRVLSIGSRQTSESPEEGEFEKEQKLWYQRIGYDRYDELDKRRKRK